MVTNDRCSETDLDAGRCELRAGHAGTHAVLGDDGFYTWFVDQVFVWSRIRPPYWLYEMAWADGFQPPDAAVSA
jgi:hypothetical protein